MFKRILKILMVIVVLIVVLTAWGAFRYNRKCATEDLNIILIVLDTVRAKNLSCYGYEKKTTPFIDDLAKDALLFKRAYAPAPWTLPSHASIFTGLYPYSHGATQEHLFLENRYETLAEILSKQNYQTPFFSSNPYVSTKTNLTQGCSDVYEFVTPSSRISFIDKILKKISSTPAGHPANLTFRKWWTTKYRPAEPFFIFINYLDAHAPYTPPYRFRRKFLQGDDLKKAEKIFAWWPGYLAGLVSYTQKDFELMETLYDGEINFLDECLKDLIGFLERRGAMKNTMLIITSDHGENFGEHGLMDHVFSLHDTLLHVPLIIKHPTLFAGGIQYDLPVQIQDIFPTILSAVEPSFPAQSPHSYSLLPDAQGRIPMERPVFSEYYYPKQTLGGIPEKHRDDPALQKFKRSLESLLVGSKKIIVASDGRNEMFDLKTDPHENNNLQEKLKVQFDNYNNQLNLLKASLVKTEDLSSETTFDKEDIEKLKALGYIH